MADPQVTNHGRVCLWIELARLGSGRCSEVGLVSFQSLGCLEPVDYFVGVKFLLLNAHVLTFFPSAGAG